MKPSAPAAWMFCQPCRERGGLAKSASIIVNGTPMCACCFGGPLPRLLPKFQDAHPCTPKHTNVHLRPGKALRRRGTVGPWAMAIARLHPEGGVFGSGDHDAGRTRSSGKFSATYLLMARVVLRHDRDLADEVSRKAITLKRAFRIVRQRRKALPAVRPDAVPQLEGTKSQKLMALAKQYPGGKYHADLDAGVYRIIKAVGVSYVHLGKARWVLRKSPDLAAAVLRGEFSLNAAWKTIRGDGAKIDVVKSVEPQRLSGNIRTHRRVEFYP